MAATRRRSRGAVEAALGGLSANIHRRHLDESQRAMAAARIASLQVGRPSEKAPIDAISDAQAAKRLNVSERSVERAKAVQREAVSEVVKLVEDGKMAVSAAVAVAKATPNGVAIAKAPGKSAAGCASTSNRRR